MFTGIITDIGEVISLKKQGDWQLRIKTSWSTSDIKIGNSNKLKKRTNWNPMFKNKELFNKLIEENKI